MQIVQVLLSRVSVSRRPQVSSSWKTGFPQVSIVLPRQCDNVCVARRPTERRHHIRATGAITVRNVRWYANTATWERDLSCCSRHDVVAAASTLFVGAAVTDLILLACLVALFLRNILMNALKEDSRHLHLDHNRGVSTLLMKSSQLDSIFHEPVHKSAARVFRHRSKPSFSGFFTGVFTATFRMSLDLQTCIYLVFPQRTADVDLQGRSQQIWLHLWPKRVLKIPPCHKPAFVSNSVVQGLMSEYDESGSAIIQRKDSLLSPGRACASRWWP